MDIVTYALLKKKGFQGTVTSLPSTGTNGQMVLFEDCLYVYDGATWKNVSASGVDPITNAEIDALF